MSPRSAKGVADKARVAQWLFDNSRDLMQVIAPDGTLLQVNRAWTDLTGLSADELVGRSLGDFCHRAEGRKIRAWAEKACPGDVNETEVRLKNRHGSWRWFAIRCQVMEDGSHIGSMHDITEERRYRQGSEETRRTREALGAAAGIGGWEFDPRKRLFRWSEEILARTGFDPNIAWTPELFLRRVHPRDRAKVAQTLSAAVDGGVDARIEYRTRGLDRWLTVRVTVHAKRLAKGVYALKGISEDITELAQARDAARKGEQTARKARREAQALARRLRLSLEAGEAGAYEIDHVRKSFWCSPEFERITGLENADYARAYDLRALGFHSDDLQQVRAAFRALHSGDKKSGDSFEARIVRPDGTERWVRVNHHLVTSRNGRWVKAVGLIQDCDARKRQEIALKEAQVAAEAAAEAKAAFLANMSHEIRTPMNGVMGVLHLLKNEHLTDEGRGLLHEALSCGQMLAELLNDVIDFSKIEAGRLELAYEPVNPTLLVEGVVRLLEPQAAAKNLQLVVDADAALGWVRSDPVRLRQALFNLVGNAVKFTESGHVVVRCRRADAGVLRFEVEDSGVGIPQAAQHRLFERFNQADASTTRRFGGSGLGLAITQRLAEMMDGHVGFTSIEGQGSTFWIEVRAEAAEAQAEPIEAADTLLSGVRVLVVEDNATNRLIATKLLEQLGAAVETAADGYAGVEAAAHGGFDLILMDIQMPGIDGLEAARRVRALGGAAAVTPIVALTANVLAHQRQAYLDAGMDGVVAKPIVPALLVAEIARAAGHSDAPTYEQHIAAA
ncbi:MAG TPA: PAS domain S-box protein [Phenylobacterium sp.]